MPSSLLPPDRRIVDHVQLTRPRIASIAIALSGLIFVGDLMVPLGVAGGVPYVVPVVLALWSPSRQDVFLSAAAGSALTILGFFLSPPSLTEGLLWTVITNRLLALGAIWSMAVAVFLYHRSRDQFAEIQRRLRVSENKRREQLALARLGQMAAIVAHEVKNPLAGMKAVLQVIGGRLEREEDQQMVDKVCVRLDSLTNSLEDMLVYARPTKLDTTFVDARSFLEDNIARFAEDPISAKITVDLNAQAGPASIDARLLGEALLNLLLNAAQAMDGDGVVQIHSTLTPDLWTIQIDDDGDGLTTEVLEQVFEPFFTTKIRGTGLGLAIVQQTVERHGGWVAMEQLPSNGARVTMAVPIARV